MRSLRARIVVLSAVMALGSALCCALAVVGVAQTTIEEFEDRQADEAVQALQRRFSETLDGLGFEVDDYANWDELYEQMPAPTTEWARINLTPGKIRGALTQYMATLADGRVVGRYHDGDVRGAQASANDPAPTEALARLWHASNEPRSGIALFAGHPALFASAPVMRSNRQGPPRGLLVAIAYLDHELRQRLQSDGWSLRLEPHHRPDQEPPGTPAEWTPPTIRRDEVVLVATTTVTTHDGALGLTLSTNRAATQRIADRTVLAILFTGLGVAVVGLLVGTWLGWRWLAPVSALAAACRDHPPDPQQRWLPPPSGLREADVLRDSLEHLVLRLRLGQDDLAQALDRESTANAVHRRFLAQLGHEFGQPVRRIIALCQQMDRRGGRLEPEELAAATALANELEERFQEILGLGDLSTMQPPSRLVALDAYLTGIAELLRPQADKARMTIRVEAPPEALPIDQVLFSPVLVNLATNAIRAGRAGGHLVLRAQVDAARGHSVWTIADNGAGLPDTIADRLRDAFNRGEILPGTPGIGMGLTLALANVRTLGGTMQLANRTEPGVTIVIRLPPARGTPAGGTASERIRRRG